MDSVQNISPVQYSTPSREFFSAAKKKGTLPLQRAVLPTFDLTL